MNRIMPKIPIRLPALLTLICFIFAGPVFAAPQRASALPSPDKIHYESLRFDLPQTNRVVLENGIVLYILENHELPLININALVKTGSIHDPNGKEGTAELTAYVMRTGGTANLSSSEIDKRFDLLAAKASVTMSTESAQVSFSVLSKNLDSGLELLAQILIHPVFEHEKIELARLLKNEELRRLKDDPQRLAFREFNRLLYRSDPRSRFPSGKSLSNITRDDLVDFHNRFFTSNNVMFAVSGDITKEEAVEKFKTYFGDWRKADVIPDIPALSPASNPGIYLINKDIPQSTIVTGLFVAAKKSRDYYPFTVLDFITGSGGFSSRILNVIRNNEGLAYSAGSFYRARPKYGVFGNYAFTKSSTTMKTLSLLDSVTENVKTKSFTPRELNWAKKSIINGFIFSFDTPEQIVWQQMNIDYENLPADFLTNYRDKIERVTIQDLNHAAAAYLDVTKNTVLILGDSKNFDKSSKYPAPFILITPEE